MLLLSREKLSPDNNTPLWSHILDMPPSLTTLNFAVWVAIHGRFDCISLLKKKMMLLECRFYACLVCLPHPPSVRKWNRGMFCWQGKGLDARIAWLKALYKMSLYKSPRKIKNLEKLTWGNLKPDFHIIVRIVSIVCYRDVSQKMCRGDRVNHLGKTFWCDTGRSGQL